MPKKNRNLLGGVGGLTLLVTSIREKKEEEEEEEKDDLYSVSTIPLSSLS